ncbi:hypothetical protein QGM71_07730 [Virgibacillus sp. C22-A2]|uniref:Uncharacterized protein n=1 Tax=Virgibacillus tibetensis TaxID=3042313 RepID=A0ABU6KDY1_9BACI|nr:hypothetical protein [Virgibacillus sp. C22-A2]
MITNPNMPPNVILYVNLGSLEPFVKSLDIPKRQLEREIKKISVENYSSYFPEVVFNRDTGKYLVVGNYITFNAYRFLYKPNLLIPCKAFYKLEEDERYLLTIDWMMKNNVNNWYDRHRIFTKLITDFEYSRSDLATFLNKEKSDIQFYLDPPPNVRNETVRQSEEKIINKISLQAFKNNHNKDYLYILILYQGLTITYEHLKYISWLRGNGIKFEECNLTLEQEHQLIDKAIHLKRDFLDEIRMAISDMQMKNGNSGPIT